MSNFLNKRFLVYRLILAALCLCLSFSSVAGAIVMAPHNMTPVDTGDQAAQLDQLHIEQHSKHHAKHHVENHHPNQHVDAHDCCDDGQEVCSTSSACAAHCAASLTQRALNLCPVLAISSLEADTVFTGLLSLNLDGPFKPPR